MATTSVLTGQHICNALMMTIGEIMGDRNNPHNAVTPIGVVQALLSPANRAGTRIVEVDSMNGQNRPVRILRKQRGTPAQIAIVKDCAAIAEKPRFEELFIVDKYIQATVTVSEASIRQLCDAAAELTVISQNGGNISGDSRMRVMMEVYGDIMLQMDALRQKMNEIVTAEIIPQVGDWVGGAPLTIPVLNQGDYSAFLQGFSVLAHEYRLAGMAGKPIVAGYGNFDYAVRALALGCCNDNGVDFGVMKNNAPFDFYEDFGIDTALNPNDLLIFAPGTIQLAMYNEYRGALGGRIDNVSRGLFPDLQLPGLNWDLRVIEDGCAEQYTIKVGLHFGVWAAPTNSYAAADRLTGVNGIFTAAATKKYSQHQVVA